MGRLESEKAEALPWAGGQDLCQWHPGEGTSAELHIFTLVFPVLVCVFLSFYNSMAKKHVAGDLQLFSVSQWLVDISFRCSISLIQGFLQSKHSLKFRISRKK